MRNIENITLPAGPAGGEGGGVESRHAVTGNGC